MYTVEFHDNDYENVVEGTLSVIAGLKSEVEYAYQAEMWLEDLTRSGDYPRAYILDEGTPLAAWRAENNGKLTCVGHLPHYPEADRLAMNYLYAGKTALVVSEISNGLRSTDDAAAWAAEQLRTGAFARAIVMHQAEIAYAWEMPDDTAVLVARGAAERTPRII